MSTRELTFYIHWENSTDRLQRHHVTYSFISISLVTAWIITKHHHYQVHIHTFTGFNNFCFSPYFLSIHDYLFSFLLFLYLQSQVSSLQFSFLISLSLYPQLHISNSLHFIFSLFFLSIQSHKFLVVFSLITIISFCTFSLFIILTHWHAHSSNQNWAVTQDNTIPNNTPG